MVRKLGIIISLIGVLGWTSQIPAAFDSATSKHSSEDLAITRITPSGEDVPAGRQIVIQFNRPVVPVGRMERDASEIPIKIVPELDCQWRWLNTSALACQLGAKEALKPATKYEVLIEPGIATQDIKTLAKPVRHRFVTERPKVRHIWFKTWKAPGMPQVRLTFNQPVPRDSVVNHVFIVLPESGGRRFRLTVEPDPDLKEEPLFLPLPGENLILVAPPGSAPEESRTPEAPKESAGVQFRRVWLASPVDELPLDNEVHLTVEPGLLSYHGAEKGVEDRVLVSFHTFPEFGFIGVRCVDNHNKKLTLNPETPLAEQEKCNPMAGVALTFTAPVISEEVKAHVTFMPDLAGGRKDYDPWANRPTYSRLRRPHKRGQEYHVWLPERLKAYQVYEVKSDPERFKDEFGRGLVSPIDMRFATNHRPPDFVLTHKQAVLESEVDSEMPLVVTNLDSVTVHYDFLNADGKSTGLSRQFKLPPALDIAFRAPLHFRELLLGRSGVIRGSIGSDPYVPKTAWERRFFAQVTPFHVHVKAGHYNTLAWVTDLATGIPVPGVSVRVYKDTYQSLSENPPVLSQSTTDPSGIAMIAGLKDLDPQLKLIHVWETPRPRLFVRVDKGDDLALVPLDYGFRVDTFRVSQYAVYPSMRRRYGHIHTWGTTAQGVYRAGDTIQYKLYVRDQSNETFVPAPKKGYTLKVIDPMGKTAHEIKALELSAFGGYHGEFSVPKTGAVGWYRFVLSSKFYRDTWEPMRVLVSDFTPAPFRVSTEINGKLFQPGDEVQIDTAARLHAGGPYVDASVRVTAIVKSRAFLPSAHAAKGFQFDVYQPGQPAQKTLSLTEGKLDDKGDLKTRFKIADSHVLYGRLFIESAVRDDRGKYVTSTAGADYAGRDRFVGLRQADWVLQEDKPAEVQILVADQGGRPVGGTSVLVDIKREVTKAARVKGAGNAYVTQYTQDWIDVAECKLESTNEPVVCSFTPSDPGTHKITATIQDTKGRKHSTVIHRWVIGKGRVLWQEEPDNSLEVMPEKTSYRVGERARYLVKNPFPGAKALITIERYGVIDRWVQTLETGTPLVEFEVKKDYIPGFFLSIVVMSPRVDQPLGDDQIDLGKPAFRMGYVQVPVVDPYKEMLVEAAPERETYKPRDRVRVSLKAKPRHGEKDEPIELAVAVLDESVLDLLTRGRDYFDPYKGFYSIDGLDLENFSLLMRLVGRQKFEKKGATPGGGGGAELGLRSLFKFVSYWNPSIVADEEGRASIEFEAPDNLTSWRVLAMAVTPTDRMGLGDAVFRVNRPTEIRPVMPNQVTEGDSFQAGFSIMNRTQERRRLNVTLTAEGVIETEPGKDRRSVTQSLIAEPYKRMTIWLPIKTKRDGEIRFTARAGDELDQDGMRHALKVNKRYSLETAATYGTTVSELVEENILFPTQIRTDVGKVSLVVSPSVISNVEGAFKYLRDFPYHCWEQILTKGVMASHYENLKAYMPADFAWEGSEDLPQRTLKLAAAYQAPNGGMAFFIPGDQYVSPYLSAYTAMAFNWLRKSGYEIPETVESKLHGYLLTLLRRNVVPDFYSKGMASTVRAVALAALAEHGKVGTGDLARYHQHAPEMSLFGKAHYLLAAIKVPGTEALRIDLAKMILAHANQSGGKFVFSETIDDSYTRILASPLRANAAVLSALLAFGETPDGSVTAGDVPYKLVRFITQSREKRDHWENTQENVFCMNALVEYSRVYEVERPDMALKASLDQETMGETRFKDLRDQPVEFQRPLKPVDPGRSATIKLQRTGTGRVYYAARLQYAPDELKADAINAGIEVHREYSVERDGKWVLLKSPMALGRGELIRVDLFVSIPTARNFVVVSDPVPGGLEPVSRDLATASVVDADKGRFQHAGGSWWFRYSDWSSYGVSRWSFYHQELRHDSARFYSEYLPAGNYHLSYTAQAISPGDFIVMPVHVEEMYDPDIFGKGVPAALEVGEALGSQ